MDRLGLSWLSLDDGHVDRRRARRSGLVRGVRTIDEDPYVVWATPEHRCAELDDQCARRATGIAPFDRGSDVLPEPTWLASHPAGRLDRSLHVESGRVWLLTARPGTPSAAAPASGGAPISPAPSAVSAKIAGSAAAAGSTSASGTVAAGSKGALRWVSSK